MENENVENVSKENYCEDFVKNFVKYRNGKSIGFLCDMRECFGGILGKRILNYDNLFLFLCG